MYEGVFAFFVLVIQHLFCAALNCHLWPVWLFHNFPHYPIKGMIFGTNVNINVCLDSLYNFC
jgi:hypothetical protein